MTPARRVRALSIHAAYRCRHAGACCTSGWAIPVEPETEARIERGLESGRLRLPRRAVPGATVPWLRSVAGASPPALLHDADGACVFFDPGSRLCAVHRDLGEGALPSACRQFPRVTTLTPLGVSVTLSHYCPTAALLLFRDDVPLAVVEDPPAFPAAWPWEGLDARDALPPFLRPGTLMDWPSLERWERFCVSALAEEGRSPEEALGILEKAAAGARRWTPERGAFGEFLEGVLEGAVARGREGEGGNEEESNERGTAFHGVLRNGIRYSRDSAGREPREWHLIADTVPHRALLPAAPEGLGESEDRWVVPAWPALSLPIRRWLAAKSFASWLALQGDGLRTAVLGLRVALGVLRAEATRGCVEAGRALDPELLREAFRRADLLLVHLADPEALARRLSRCETGSGPA